MSVTDNTHQSRYEMQVEGVLAIADYNLRDNRLAITHVEVPDALRGQGIAAKLMAHIVEDAKARKLEIVPICSYAAAYMQRHPIK